MTKSPAIDRLSRRTVVRNAAISGAAIGALATQPVITFASSLGKEGTLMTQASPEASPASSAPTVVLVHGAFADASSWSPVVALLQAAGIPTLAIANPLRGIAADAAYAASVINGIPGPVLLVGHSYGGSLITNASPNTPNAIGLVYIAAFALDEGEVAQDVLGEFPPVPLLTALVPASIPPSEAELELIIDPAKFPQIFAADLPSEETSVMAVSQRPVAAAAFVEPWGVPGWKTLPSWFLVAKSDQVVGTEAERHFAERAGSITVEVESSHAVMLSHPQEVVDLITSALGTLG